MQDEEKQTELTIPRLNWKAYFRKFCDEHGGDPVNWNGVLLFRDGWTHAPADYRGPEYRPPDDARELKRMQVAYWTIRQGIVKRQIIHLKQMVESLQQTQAMRSAKLQQTILNHDANGKRKIGMGDVDLQGIVDRLLWLEGDADDCERHLRGSECDSIGAIGE